jgi:hypothetical protein
MEMVLGIGSRFKWIVFLGIVFFSPTLSQATGKLDQDRVHGFYNDGDFDHVVAIIDSFTHVNKTYSLSDSVFIAKHLSVVYTANPATREKGKGYMFRLLDLMPSAKIVDMFVSDEIDRIFDKVREEYVVRERNLGKSSRTAFESDQYASGKMIVHATPEKKSSAHASYWLAGGVAFVAITGATYYFLSSNTPKDKVYGMPSK